MKHNNEIILCKPDSTVSLEVRVEDETVWLTQQQIADLFGVKQPAISKHLKNIFQSGELDEFQYIPFWNILPQMAKLTGRNFITLTGEELIKRLEEE